MSLTTDNVTPSPMPNVWRVGKLTIAGIGIGLCLLLFCSAVLAFGVFRLHLSIDSLQKLAFVAVAFGSQATIFAIRERRHFRSLWPSRWLLLSATGSVLISALLALFGILMTPLFWTVVVGIFAGAVVFGLVLNVIKIPLFRRLQIS